MARRDGGPDQRLMIAIASRQTTSSIDSAPCQRTAGVGQTFSNVSDASSSTSAAKSASHFIWTLEFFTRDKKIRRLIFAKILLIFWSPVPNRVSLRRGTLHAPEPQRIDEKGIGQRGEGERGDRRAERRRNLRQERERQPHDLDDTDRLTTHAGKQRLLQPRPPPSG